MGTFKKYIPENEKELHAIIEKELDNLEEGLTLLQHEMPIGTSIPDFLCVDNDGRLMIIEVKLDEDENVLFQGLKYYLNVYNHRYHIKEAFRDKNINIDPEKKPRIILIAKNFSDDVRKITTLVEPEVELYEYTTIIDSHGNKGIVYHPVNIPKIYDEITEPTKIDDHINYLSNESLKPVLTKIMNEIKGISKEIEEKTTQSYIGYKFRGHLIGGIETYRKYFDLWVNKTDDEGNYLYWIRIENGNEDYSEVLEKIKEYYKELGGKP